MHPMQPQHFHRLTLLIVLITLALATYSYRVIESTTLRIGRDWERTIYLKDDEIISSVLEDIKTVLDERVRRNEMTKLDRDYILSKFRNVNVADAQAYRSLSSYRAILGMSGQWTDDMERAYNNFKNGWNIVTGKLRNLLYILRLERKLG